MSDVLLVSDRDTEGELKAMRTIRLVLLADAETRQHFWCLSLVHTFLVNELFQTLPKHKDFPKWQRQRRVSVESVKKLIDQLKKKDFLGTPPQIFSSAIAIVCSTFKAYFALQQKCQLKLDGMRRWLRTVESDLELARTTAFSAETICSRARALLVELEAQRHHNRHEPQLQASHEPQPLPAPTSLMSDLFKRLESAEDPLERRAVVHLLKNACAVNVAEEDPDKLALRLEKKKIQIQRLEKQMASRLPVGRDPTGDRAHQAIEAAISFAEHTPVSFWLKWHGVLLTNRSVNALSLELWVLGYLYDCLNADAEFEAWEQALPSRMANLSTQWAALPYPLIFDSTDDLYWSRAPEPPLKPPCSGKKAAGTMKPLHHKRKRSRTRKRQKKLTERIMVRFKGKGLSHCRFKVGVDRRQLPIVQQMVDDEQAHKARAADDKFSLGLFALRSACLRWDVDPQKLHTKQHWKLQSLWLKWFCTLPNGTLMQQSELDLWFISLFYLALSKSIPWQTHRLSLHCTIDPRLLTAEGTEAVRQEKLAQTLERIAQVEKKLQLAEQQTEQQAHEGGETLATAGEITQLDEDLDEESVAQKQESVAQKRQDRQGAIKRLHSTLTRLGNASPSRPPRQPFAPQRDIAIGVCFSRKNVLGVAVVDTRSQAVLEFCNLRSLLTDDRLALLTKRAAKIPASRKGKRSVRQFQLKDYRLFNRWRRLRHQNLTQRGDQQRHGLYAESSQESNLAQHLNRVIAKKLLQLAQQWQASRLTLPDFGNLRESVECEMQARARRKFPDDNVKLQKQYAKELRMFHHRWNHKQLAQCLRACAARTGVPVITGTQPKEGELRDKAVALALAG